MPSELPRSAYRRGCHGCWWRRWPVLVWCSPLLRLSQQNSHLAALEDRTRAAEGARRRRPRPPRRHRRRAPDPVSADAAPAPRINVKPIIQTVPYGVEPFSGSRLDAMRQLFDRLPAQGFQGNVDIRTYSGRFCLVGNATDGYSLAPDELPYARCDMVSGASNDQTGSGVRIPVVLADLMGTLRAGSHDQIHVQVSGGDSTTSARPIRR